MYVCNIQLNQLWLNMYDLDRHQQLQTHLQWVEAKRLKLSEVSR